MQGFRRMDEKGRGAGAGEGCRQLFTDVAGFTDTGDNQFALAVDNGFRRADEVVARRSGRRLASCSSSIRVWRPASNKKLLMMFSSNNDFNTFGFQRPLEFRVNIGIGNQFIHAFKAADNIGAFTTKLG